VGFLLKWTDEHGEEPLSSKAFETCAAAVNAACYMLRNFRRKPIDIWVVERGGRLAMSLPAIIARCSCDRVAAATLTA
jgi:hypothetical protein